MNSTHQQRYPVVPGILFLLLLLALLALPEAVRRLAVRELENSLQSPVSIMDVDLNLMTGNARISGLVIGAKNGPQPILELASLDLEFALRPLLDKQIIIRRVTATGARVHLERTGLLQYQGAEILRPVEEEWGVVGDYKVDIQGFEAYEGQITVTDHRTTPELTTTMGNISLRARPLVQKGKPTRIDLDLTGIMEGTSPMTLKGWFTPFAQPLQLQLEGNLQDYELSHLNPYAIKYLGSEFRRGRLSSEFNYHIGGGQIDAVNELTIRQAQVGNKVGDQFEQQVGISLKLALSLLEDSSGTVHLPLTVKGRLDSPDFESGGSIWKGLRNAVLKGLVAPLRLLGNIVTLGGKITEVRIAPVSFKPGSMNLDGQAKGNIDRLSAFLKERPAVDLQLRGRSSRQDSQAIARKKPRGRKVTDRDLGALAERRVRLIEKTLVQKGVPANRLFVVTSDGEAVAGRGPGRVEFRVIK